MGQKLVPVVDGEGQKVPHFFRDEKTGIIYYQRRMNNRKHNFSCKTDSLAKARKEANALLASRLGTKKKHVRTLLGTEMDEWIEQKELEELSPSQMYSVRRGVRQLKPYWGKKLPTELTQEAMPDFYKWWKKKHPKIQMGTALRALKSIAIYLHRKIENGHSVLPAVPKFRDPDAKKNRAARAKKKDHIFSPEELAIVRETALDSDEELIILFMYTMATRIDETLKMEFGVHLLMDRPDPQYVWFFGSNKADHKGSHFLHPSLHEPLRRLRDRRAAEGTNLAFPQVRNNQKPMREQQIDWAAWRKRAELGWHWTPHIFRHTCLSMLLNDPSVPQAAVCKQYRVSLKVLMDTYFKVTPDTVKRLTEAVVLIDRMSGEGLGAKP